MSQLEFLRENMVREFEEEVDVKNRLANAETTKTIAEANKIAGVDTEGQELNNKWQEIENRIQLSKENIAESNVTEAAANAKKAIELWKQEALNTKYLDKTQEERVAKLVSEIALLQKEGAVQDSIVDVNYNTARKIQKEVENFYYEMITKRYRDWETDRKSTRLNSSHSAKSRMPSSA